jgi:hypothetical protein
VAWSTRFHEPIKLPNGRKLATLKDAIAWLAKEASNSEHGMKQAQAVYRCDAMISNTRYRAAFSRRLRCWQVSQAGGLI